MRESAKTERMHLPRDSTEAWLGLQRPKPGGVGRHRNLPQGAFEAWLEKLVERRRGRTAARGLQLANQE